MIKKPWSNEKKTDRINFTIEPSLKETVIQMINSDISTYIRDKLEKEALEYLISKKSVPEKISSIIGKQFKALSEKQFSVFNYRGLNYPYCITDAVTVEIDQPLEIIGYDTGLILVKTQPEFDINKQIYITN